MRTRAGISTSDIHFIISKTVSGDSGNFVTAAFALSNTPQRSVYNYARGRYFALGYALCSFF